MIHPNNKLKHIWDSWILLITVFVAIQVPLEVIFDSDFLGMSYFNDIFYTAFFALDIVFHFRTALKVQRNIVKDPRIVAANYMRGWFWVDLLAAIPFDLLLELLVKTSGGWVVGNELIKLFRLNRLLRLSRLQQILGRWQKSNVVMPSLFRLVILVFWILLIAHWVACGWYFMGGIVNVEDEVMRYTRALYWTITTLTTVGYGDITPQNLTQTVYTMVVMILGAGIYGYVIGNIASVLAKIDVASAQHMERLEQINAFLKYRSIPPALSDRILSYYNYIWESRMGYDETVVIQDLPPALKTDVSLYLNRDIIQKVPLFKGASDSLIREIVLELKPFVAMPGDYIFRKGEVGTSMYFISLGTVDVVTEDDGPVLATLTEGSFFGEIALLMSTPRTASIRAASYSDMYTLDKEKFDRILEKYPEFAQTIREMARQRAVDVDMEDQGGSALRRRKKRGDN